MQIEFDDKQRNYLIFAIVFGLLSGIFLCCIYCGFQSLKLAIDVIDASADFLNKTKRIVLVPVFYFILMFGVILLWFGALLCVLSLNEITPDPDIPQGKSIKWTDEKNYWFFYFMIFGIFWICSWFVYTNNFIVQVSAASYYFDSNKDRDGTAQVGLGFKFAYINHMGSLAFGSFVIAIISFVKIVFVYAAQ
jgi:hypothetical protein